MVVFILTDHCSVGMEASTYPTCNKDVVEYATPTMVMLVA